MSFKIYQLHKRYKEWENNYDYIIGSYLRKEKAEEEKNKAELEERELREKWRKCFSCPLLDNGFENINTLFNKYPDYCSEPKLERTDYGINCNNYYGKWNKSIFDIEEIEVVE